MAGLSKAAQDLGDIRRAAMGAAREVREFDAALRALRRRLIRAMQIEGLRSAKEFAARFERLGLFANKNGALQRVKPYGDAWGKRKKRLGLDSRRGVARKGVLKTMRAPAGFARTTTGFEIDLKKPDITVTGRATVGKSRRNLAGKRIIAGKGKSRAVIGIGLRTLNTNRRSFRVNNYLDHFVNAKAPGLKALSKGQLLRIQREVKAAIEEDIQRTLTTASRKLSLRDRIRLRIDFGNLFS
jgi:hypothetical protein